VSRTAIHDLGYKRYLGQRRPLSTRWRVIARNQFAYAWKGWTRLKMWGVSVAMVAVGMAVAMYISKNEIFDHLLSQAGMPISFVDAVIPWSFEWLMRPAVMVTVLATCATFAKDLKSRAFEFYFARPVLPRDYLFGKIAGTWLCIAVVLLAPLLALALYRVGLSKSGEELVQNLWFLPKGLLVGMLATTLLALVPLAVGSLSTRPGSAIATWAAWYWIAGPVARALAKSTWQSDFAAIDLSASLVTVVHEVYAVRPISSDWYPSLTGAVLSLGAYAVLSVLLLTWRVRTAARAGLGGA